jgi:hypothetical protein
MPLRILHALPTGDPKAAGLTEEVLLLAAVARRLPHHVEILTFAAPGTNWLLGLGVPVHRVGDGESIRACSRGFRQWLRQHASDYDCVVISGTTEFGSFRAGLLLRNAGTPYFAFGPRDPGSRSGAGWRQRGIMQVCWLWAGYPMLRDAHAVFFLSEAARRGARESLWPYDCHEFVLACGVSGPTPETAGAATAEFLTAHPGLAGKRLFVLRPGASARARETVLQAVHTLARAAAWDRASMRLVVAETPGSSTADAWERGAAHCGLADTVTLVDAPPDGLPRGLLPAAEALFVPVGAENAGLIVAEALAAGIPLLIARGPNLWREVVNSGAGLAGDETIPGLADLFNRWFSLSVDERSTLHTNARQAFEAQFSEQAAANAVTAVTYLMLGAHQSDVGSADRPSPRREVDFL